MCCSRCSDGEFYWSGCKCPCHLPETPMTHTPIPKQEDVPEAARKAFTCFHDFKPVDPLDTTSIAVYCHKCGTTVEGNEIIPPVAYSLGTDKGDLPSVKGKTDLLSRPDRMLPLETISGTAVDTEAIPVSPIGGYIG